MMARAANLFWRITYARYLMASAVALATDLSFFMMLLNIGMAAVPAAAFGYCFGVIAHWVASSRLVFADRVSRYAWRRRKQKMMFVASMGAGLTVTMVIVGAGSHLGFDPRLAKLIAAAVSFHTTYLLRKAVVFA